MNDLRYFWNGEMHYINFYKDNLEKAFAIFEKRSKTSTFMHDTGVKDMKRKLIYEGDIVTLDWDKKAIGIISHGAGFFKIKWNKQGSHINERIFVLTGLRMDDTAPFEYSNSSLIVIGNIYENQELLLEESK